MVTVNQAKAVWCCSQCGAIYHKDYPRCPNDGAEIVMTTGDPLVGKRIDNYVIDDLIGEGGMGRVYRAHHANLPGKHYAIKVLLGDVAATASMRKRFVQEAQIASKLDHPNLVGVVDFGATPSGLPYIAMDFVDGEVLTDILDRGPMPWPRVVEIGRAIAEGLAYVHEAGLVHRDLKPDNVLVVKSSKGGEVPRLTDFGLVMSQEPQGEGRLTSTGMAMGTPAYAAPEQMAGKPLDHRADLFSLGMTIYEMLTGGKLPWEGTAMEIATAKAHRDAMPIRARAPDIRIPHELDALLVSLLSRRVDERPETARAVIRVLAQIADPSHVTDATGIIKRPRSWLMPAAIVALAAAAAGSLAVRRLLRTPDPVAQVSPSPVAVALAPAPPVVAPVPAPPVVAPVAATPVVAPDAISAADPTAEPQLDPPAQPKQRPRTKHKAPPRRVVAVPAPPVEAVTVIPPKDPPKDPVLVAAPPPVPPVPAPPIPPPKPVELRASLVGVDVHGSLPEADVERAVRRTMSSIERCMPKQPEHITARLTIGESRRAQGVGASGGSASGCVAAALAAVRTESAPDVGDVTVVVHVSFAAKL
ncbi:MAG: serine/threonine protein kinase [Myxococcales bacterium]|nr:serine/threonine protein kinase [Myxococcales bacterium]